MKTLLKNCYIVCENSRVIKNGFLGVENEDIVYLSEIQPKDYDKYDLIKDMNNKIIIPSLINSHTHSPMVLLRGVGSDLPLSNWLFDKIFPLEKNLTPDQIYVATQLAMLEMLSSGTGNFSDMYLYPEKTLEVVKETGMKANITYCVTSFDENEDFLDNEDVKSSISFFKKYNDKLDDKILIDFSLHAEYTNTEKIIKGYSEFCKEYDGNMHIHLSETQLEHQQCKDKYGMTPTKLLHKLGVFDSRAQAAHCVFVEDEDIDILKEKNVTVIHNPTSNMKLGSGFFPLSKLLKKGVNISLGTDGAASNNNLNMFEEMHLASIIHKGYENDPTLLSPSSVLNMATVNGAKMQGRKDTGVLKVGNKADIVAIDLNKPHLIPHNDIISTIVYSAQASDVCLTMINGKVLYENGNYTTLDSEKIMYDFKKQLLKLYK